MGRGTYDFIANEVEIDWPYKDQRVIVVTSHPLDNPLGPLEIWTKSIDDLVAELRRLDAGDVWMVGGGKLQMAFLERGALDELEIYLVPELIGGGAPLFPPMGFRTTPTLLSANGLDGGVARLHYRFG